MNRERIIYMIILVSFSLALSSCQDFLDKQPLDTISKATFWKTQEDANKGLTACYGRLHNAYTGATHLGGSLFHSAGMSDEAFAPHLWDGNYNNVAKGLVESTSNGVTRDMWYTSYGAITTCNVFLENIDNVTMTEELRNRMKGEVLFLRAFWYNYLTAYYGDCPLITKVLTIEESQEIVRTPKAQVVSQILADLDEAIALLPDEIYAGHAVKGSAQALKARVCLWNEQWTEAAAAAKAVMDNPLFDLHPEYLDLFNGNAEDGNKEILFSVKYLAPDIFHNIDQRLAGEFVVAPLEDYVASFEKLAGWDEASPFENRDPRLRLTIIVPGDPFPYSNPDDIFDPAVLGTQTQYGLKKFIKVMSSASFPNDQDIVHLRLADVMLMYAEAKLKAGENDASALKALNDVRARFGDTLPPKTILDMDAIMYERKIELGFEGLRHFDIKRWKIGPEAMNNLVDPIAGNYFFDPNKHYLFPIPEQEMSIMGSAFGQNPGY